MIPTLLGGLTADEFLADYWQKKPLLVRGAIPGFTGVSGVGGRDDMLALAARDDVESRFVSQADGWTLEHGPFKPSSLKRRARPWTVLVQSVNLVSPEGDRLMREFDFIPYARLDDLMVSYATDGGGVGPHFDSYDVFLLQGIGRRRWRIGKQRNQDLIEGLPVRILADFRPTQEWLLEPGDMLYLPPEWAHDGVAEGECMTWSIGFRAFPAQELAEQFLMHLQDTVSLDSRYRDPQLQRQRSPAQIGDAMIDQVGDILARVSWNRSSVRDFLGRMLTEPKPHVFFDPPERPLAAKRFASLAERHGVALDPRTQLLFAGTHFYLNGEAITVPGPDRRLLRQLADRRDIETIRGISATGIELLHEWYLCGFLAIREP
jgi:50S ribosomal protein L16 3-hydroxylase